MDDIPALQNEINKSKLSYMNSKYLSNPSDEILLSKIKNAYSKIQFIESRLTHGYFRSSSVTIPYNIAKGIMVNCKEYPNIIVNLAEKACRNYAGEHVVPVGEIVEQDKWFDNN